MHIAIISGANVNFDRLQFIVEKAELGEKTEAFCIFIVPERPGSFMKMMNQVHPRAVTEFSYRYSNKDNVLIYYISFKVKDFDTEAKQVLDSWSQDGMKGFTISENELVNTCSLYGRWKSTCQ